MRQVEKGEVDEVLNIDVKTASLIEDETAKEIKITIQFTYLEANRTARDSRFTSVRYPISIYLGEAVGSRKGKAIIPFSMEAKTSPDIASFVLKGDAHIYGIPEEIESWVVPNGDKAPRIWTRIYQEAVAMLTILAKFISVPPPPAPASRE
ncbi:MAG: hypothetical protein ACE5NN_02925 [Candidatus Bathyarchaeia archaeon]